MSIMSDRQRVLGTYEWLGARLRLGMPEERWFARLDDLLGIKSVDLENSDAPGEITVLNERQIHSFADRVPFANCNDLMIWLALTTTDVLAEKRGAFLLHAACFVANDEAVLVFGPPYSGKSTLASLALERGQDIIGDDVVHLAPETGLAQAVPRPLKRRITKQQLAALTGDPLEIGAPLYGQLDGEACVLAPRTSTNIYPPQRSLPVRCSIFLQRHSGTGVETYEVDRFKALTCLLDWARDWSTPTMACAHRSARQLLALPYVGLSVGDGAQEDALDTIMALAR